MLVAKFGGTSVGSAERMIGVADIIRSMSDPRKAIVVSAMSGVTDALIAGARSAEEADEKRTAEIRDQLLTRHLDVAKALLHGSVECSAVVEHVRERIEDYDRLCESIATLGELTLRGQDAVASIGEDLSSCILAAYMRLQGVPSKAVSATELVRTDERFGAATPDMVATRCQVQERLRPLVEQGVVPVITGFIGATPSGAVATLGRGGSDFSAAILGVSLDADRVQIWTDVSGILTADPKLVPEAVTIPVLSYEEAEELAYFGANVLHPKTVAPLAAAGIDLSVLNTFAPSEAGTLITSTPAADRPELPAIISTEGLSLVNVIGNGSGWSLDTASRALGCLADDGLDVLMFSQSFSERSLNLVVRSSDQQHAIHVLELELARDRETGAISGIDAMEQVATLSVVGMPGRASGPIAHRAFACLGKLGLRVVSVAQVSSAYSVSFVISEEDMIRAVPFIHAELGL